MNQLTTLKTMSSREIADLTNKDHKNVVRDIKNMMDQLSIDALTFERTYMDQLNRSRKEYLLDQETTLCLVSGYSAPLRMKIIKRWSDLEKNNGPSLPQTFAEALQLAADQAKQLEIAAPKVEFYDRVADVGNLMTAGVVGKKIGMSAQVLNTNLDHFKVYDKRQRGRVFNQWFIDKGYGEIKKTENGFNSSKFTNKGEQWVIEKFVSEGIV